MGPAVVVAHNGPIALVDLGNPTPTRAGFLQTEMGVGLSGRVARRPQSGSGQGSTSTPCTAS